MPRGSVVRLGRTFLSSVWLALLHIQPVRTAPDGDILAGLGILAQRPLAVLQRVPALVAAIDRQAAAYIGIPDNSSSR